LLIESADTYPTRPHVPAVTRGCPRESLGVGRPSDLLGATERNLRDQEYEWTGVILQSDGATFASAVDFKAPERRKLTERGYTITPSLGDQRSDLIGGYADWTFKLPNPVHFLP
jgi:HAD superfamily, subfamily IIIB (Acid phosphatase)